MASDEIAKDGIDAKAEINDLTPQGAEAEAAKGGGILKSLKKGVKSVAKSAGNAGSDIASYGKDSYETGTDWDTIKHDLDVMRNSLP